MTFYKILAADGVSPQHGGSCKWFAPKGKRPGKWMPAVADIEPCYRGYHFVTLDQLPQWLGPTLYEVEVRGRVIHRPDKSVTEQARLIRKMTMWNDKMLRLFAADCAEHVLNLYEKKYPNDDRPRKAIQTARDFASGSISLDELNAVAATGTATLAAFDAVATVALAAVAAVAFDAVRAARVARVAAARVAAVAATDYVAAVAAFRAAAAARVAAPNDCAESKWQSERLRYYLEGGAARKRRAYE